MSLDKTTRQRSELFDHPSYVNTTFNFFRKTVMHHHYSLIKTFEITQTKNRARHRPRRVFYIGEGILYRGGVDPGELTQGKLTRGRLDLDPSNTCMHGFRQPFNF